MEQALLVLTFITYGLLLAILFIYGMNFMYLTWAASRHSSADPVLPPMTHVPYVGVHLPIFNELYVAERLIHAAAQLEWDRERLEILVLDDSTDETREVVRKAVESWRARGVNIQHLHRTDRSGYKAGALAAGLQVSRAELIAYFDADFVPPRDFLRRTIPHFENPKLGFLQTRWGHLNRDYSLLTFLQALSIDGHFMVEQFARYRSGYWFNFNGTGGVWRRAAIVDAGGWTQETLTEDLDLSYRSFFKGWQAIYLRDVVCPAELPVTLSAYRRQQHRWAKGSLQCAYKLLPQVWRAPLGMAQKFEATLHLTGYMIHLYMFAMMLIYPLVIYFAQRSPEMYGLWGIGALFNLSTLAPAMFFTIAQAQLGRGWWRRIPFILFFTALGAGLMPNTVRAAWQLARGDSKTFERTPKFGIDGDNQTWVEKKYKLPLDGAVLFEVLVAAWNLATFWYAVQAGNWVVAFYGAIFFTGVSFVAGQSILQTIRERQFVKRTTPVSPVLDTSGVDANA
jgi:cellulose synthase/poly-beta-1,6-N-acetylglucosamine synthase-like glycosyltransferase